MHASRPSSSTITLYKMKTIEIKGTFRNELGKKSSKQSRNAGNVPCVIYAKDGNIHFEAPELSFKNLVYTHEAHLVKLLVDDKEFNVILKDIQFHPVSDRIIHVDFVQISKDKPVIIGIPVKVTGTSAGVLAGGKLVIKKRNLKVKGYPNDLPEELTVDITELKIHESLKVGDLSYDKIELLDPKKDMVVGVATSRVAKTTEEEAAEAAPAAEGEAPAAPAEAKEKEKK
jgi:large subunit ribosomal protein L25